MIRREPDGRIYLGKWEYVVIGMILVSVLDFSLETIPDQPKLYYTVLRIVELTTVCFFTVEYIVRVSLSRPRRSYLFSFWGIIDLLAILPFYLALGFDLRSLRVLQVFRILRLVKLIRYNSAILRFHRAFVIVKDELALFGFVALLVIFISLAGIYLFENEAQPAVFSSIFASMWWAIVTLTTVGYGDVYPVTVGGKIFTFFVLMVGLGVVAVPTGLIASALSKVREEQAQKCAN